MIMSASGLNMRFHAWLCLVQIWSCKNSYDNVCFRSDHVISFWSRFASSLIISDWRSELFSKLLSLVHVCFRHVQWKKRHATGLIQIWILYVFSISSFEFDYKVQYGQTLIRAYINTPDKKIGVFSIFEKNSKWKEKSQGYRIQDYVMHTKNKFSIQKVFVRKMFVCVQNLALFAFQPPPTPHISIDFMV